ncbi:MAG: hypothetical protein WCP19_08015 [Chloroflexota bacterium]
MGAIVHNYKSFTTCKAILFRGPAGGKVGQRDFREGTIRDEKAHQAIAGYFIKNLIAWRQLLWIMKLVLKIISGDRPH